jgi:hypothetical protein
MTAGLVHVKRMRWDWWLLLVLALAAAGLLMATPSLIQPFSEQTAWYESPAMFPRMALLLALLGGLTECLLRRDAVKPGDSEELDSSEASMPYALAMVALFALYMVAVPWMGYLSSTVLFLLASGRLLGLPWRLTLMLSCAVSMAMWGVFVQVLHVYFGHGWLI